MTNTLPTAHTLIHPRELQASHTERGAEKNPLTYQSTSDEAMSQECRATRRSPSPGTRYDNPTVLQPVTTENVSEILKMMQQLKRVKINNFNLQ